MQEEELVRQGELESVGQKEPSFCGLLYFFDINISFNDLLIHLHLPIHLLTEPNHPKPSNKLLLPEQNLAATHYSLPPISLQPPCDQQVALLNPHLVALLLLFT